MPAGMRQAPLCRSLAAALLPALLLIGAPSDVAADATAIGILVVPEDPAQPKDFFVDDRPLDAKRVGVSLWTGVRWLKRKQGRSGSWGATKGNAAYGGGFPRASNPAGPTALALYALLRARVPVGDPAIRRGFDYLARCHKRPASSFETSMVLLALTATADKQPRSRAGKARAPKLSRRYRSWALRMQQRLLALRVLRGWRYNVQGRAWEPGGPEDLSSTWLAALALLEAQRVGLRTSAKVWEDILAFAIEQQDDDGPIAMYVDPTEPKKKLLARARGYAYIKGRPGPDEGQATGGMTACGVATIQMARFVLSEGGRKRARWGKRADAKRVQAAIFDGLAWLEHHWQPFENPAKRRWNVYHGYWWFALESAMSLTATKQIGTHPWYVELGQELVNHQRKAGHWDTKTSVAPSDTLDTCFALLLLGRNAHGLIPHPSVRGGRRDPPAKD